MTDKERIEEILEEFEVEVNVGVAYPKAVQELLTLLETSKREAEQAGFAKAWGVVKKLMSCGSPEEAEKYLNKLSHQDDEKGEQE